MMDCRMFPIYLPSSLYLGPIFFQGPEGDENMAMAVGNPEKYVLKPQLEGGGESGERREGVGITSSTD